MKRLFWFLLPLYLLSGCREKEYTPLAVINPILGDASWITEHGAAPGADVSEQERIASHLRYAEQTLRNADVQSFTEEQQQRRRRLLDLLKAYHERGIFPRNTKYDEGRRPCFIDDEGRICAVGYLVEQTLGRAVAEDINSRYQYATIEEMDLSSLRTWMHDYGVTARELAMIQPTYGSISMIGSVYAEGSALFSSSNTMYGGASIGFFRNRQREGTNFWTKTFRGRSYSLHYLPLTSSAYFLGAGYGEGMTFRKLKIVGFASASVGMWADNGQSGFGISPSLQFSKNLIAFKGFGLSAVAGYRYMHMAQPAQDIPQQRSLVMVGLRLSRSIIKDTRI